MKKFLSFLLFALCLTVAANAQPVTYDFEDGTIPAAFTNDETYPWIVIDTTDDDGNAVRCIRSSNKGVASSISAIEITLSFAADGHISFDALCMGEGTNTAWDKCIFYIDDEVQFTYGAHIAGWNHYAYYVSAGSHTFKWEYKKDSSVNPAGDAFFVDNIVFGLGTDPCEVPSNVTVSDITTNSATVSWTGSAEQYNVRRTIYYSDFESEESIEGWTSLDIDGDGNNWRWLSNEESSHSGNHCLGSDSWYSGALDPDNWLISPAVNLGGALSVWVRSFTSWLDNFIIYLCPNTNWSSVDEFVPLTDLITAPSEWTKYTVDLSAYAEQQGRIAIRHCNSYDKYTLLVDDFSIYETLTGATSDNHVTFTGLESDAPYQVQVQGNCSDGSLTEWSEPVTFNTHGFCDVPTDLVATPGSTTAILEWTGYQEQYTVRYQTLESYNSQLVDGMATVTLTEGDVWGDGTGYQMLLDADATAYGSIIPETGGLTTSGDASADVYGAFEYKIPENADGSLTTSNILINESVTISIPAGTYDYCITNPNPGDRVWIASNDTDYGRYDDFVFEAGNNYEFVVSFGGSHDRVDLTVTSTIDNWTTVTNVSNPAEITGLEPETAYIVQVQGICEDGVTAWSEPVEFTTEEEPACVINTIEITGFTEPVYGATPDYDVEVPADADYTLNNVFWAEYNSEMTAETFVANWYFMVFDIAPNEGCIFADNLTVTINGDASLVDPDYGGILSDVYKYRVFTLNYYLSVPPCETPTNVTVSDITTNNATVSWTGSLEEYNVLYGTNLINYRSDFETDESVDGWSIFDVDGDGYNWEWFTSYSEYSHSGTSFLLSRSYNSEALDPDNWLIAPTIDLGGTMSVWVRSWDDGYLDNFAIYLTTNPDYEGVEDFNIELVGETTAPYEWTEYTADLSAYVGQRGAIAIRHFNSADNWYLLVDDFSVIDGTAMTATGNSIELTNLDPETTYEVQVQGICEYSVSAWSEPVEFTTTEETEEPCEAPTNLTATNITATSAKLGWTGNLEQYTVRYKDDAASDWTTATTANRFFPLTGLTPATTYTAQVQGDCGSGAKSVTDWSDPVTFTTLSGTVEPGECGPAVDCEGTSYPTVKIGDVCWMAKNLAAETCVTTGNVYAYVNDQFPDEDANVETYGLLYDEEAAFATGICPEGYTLPTTEQFEYLKNNFTVEELRNSTGWVVNTGTNGTGFSWDGSGFYNGTSDNFEHMLMEGYLWAVDMTSGTPQPAMYKMMYYCNEIVRVYDFDGISASIRCVKDAEPQPEPEPEPEPEPFRCGTSNLKIGENSYETVQIGNQCWTKTNMREPVGEEVTSGNAEYPATEAYRFKVPSRDLAIYGYLYNWKAANMVCPTGWHLPTDAEWTQMENVLSTIPIDPDATGDRGDHLGKLAAYDENWDPSSTPNTPGYTEPFDDRNLSGFSARPMGYYWRGFDAQTRYAQFWTATENPEDNTKAYDRWMGYLYTSVQRYSHSKTIGYSVRCVRDSE